jgi:hypothetical protein
MAVATKKGSDNCGRSFVKATRMPSECTTKALTKVQAIEALILDIEPLAVDEIRLEGKPS